VKLFVKKAQKWGDDVSADCEARWAARMERNAQRSRDEKCGMERVWDEVSVAKMGAAFRSGHEMVCYGVD
jgi:hypothetical protein